MTRRWGGTWINSLNRLKGGWHGTICTHHSPPVHSYRRPPLTSIITLPSIRNFKRRSTTYITYTAASNQLRDNNYGAVIPHVWLLVALSDLPSSLRFSCKSLR